MECGHPYAIGNTSPAFRNIEDYLRGKLWIEFLAEIFSSLRADYYSVTARVEVKKVLPTQQIGCMERLSQLKGSMVKDWGYRPVLVGVVQIPKKGKQFKLRVLPSVIRLEAVNSAPNPFGRVREPTER